MDDRTKQLLTLGREHYDHHEYDKAEHYLEQVVERGSAYADVFHMLGVIRHDRGDLGGACESFERALEINPRYTEASLNLAVTYNDLGRYDDAKRVYQGASTSGPAEGGLDPYVKGKIANLHAEVARAYADAELFSEAMHELRKAIQLCPHFVDLRMRLSALYKQQGDLVAARFELDEALRHKPDHVDALVALGVVRLAAGDVVSARKAWERVLEIDAEHRSAQMYLRMAAGAE